MHNQDIRTLAKRHGVRFYEIGAAIGVSEATITRWLRFELPADKKEQLLQAIADIAGQREEGKT